MEVRAQGVPSVGVMSTRITYIIHERILATHSTTRPNLVPSVKVQTTEKLLTPRAVNQTVEHSNMTL